MEQVVTKNIENEVNQDQIDIIHKEIKNLQDKVNSAQYGLANNEGKSGEQLEIARIRDESLP